jgi:hypothetical protein
MMVENATWRLKSKEAVTSKFRQLTQTDVNNTVLAKEAGCHHGTQPSIQFVKLVDTVTRCHPTLTRQPQVHEVQFWQCSVNTAILVFSLQ